MKILIIRNFPSYMAVKNNTYNIQEVGFFISRWNKMYSKECVLKILPEYEKCIGLVLGEDTVFNHLLIRYARNGKTIQKPNSYFYDISDSESSVMRDTNYIKYIKSCEKAYMVFESILTEVVETKNIVKTATGAEVDGVAVDINSLVSMNMWGLTPEFLDVLEEGFKEFFEKEVPGSPLKAEYLIPIFIGELLEQGKMSVKVLKTNDTWYGMTYHEDVAAVKGSFKEMLENGVYKADLFSDL